MPPLPSEIAGRVGLSLSGGGYRAAAFHLGVMDYLHRLELLDGLRALSTVSGGSFTGACYALSLVEGEDFEAFFRRYAGLLCKTELVDLALDRLDDDVTWVPSKRRDLSVAAADVYCKHFFCDRKGAVYRMSALTGADISLERFTINTTEFRHGDVFRFSRGGQSGSDALPLADSDVGAVRVGDAVATSACFPGGFEPLVFPDDFHWPDKGIPAGIQARFGGKDGESRPLALMDGGIIDNQGVESLLRADAAGEPFDLLVVSDVDQERPDLYPAPAPGDGGGARLSWVSLASTLLFILCVVCTLAVTIELIRVFSSDGFENPWHALAVVVPLVLVVAVITVLIWLRRLVVRVVLPSIPQVGQDAIKYLRRLRVNQVSEMLSLRVSSLLALTNTIYMRRIRNLGRVMLDHETNHAERSISVRIVRLRDGHEVPAIPGVEPPSAALRGVATSAAEVPTLLWFENEHQLPDLLACGHATLCYELMQHLQRHHGERASFPAAAEALWARLADDWATLNRDPHAFVRDRGVKIPAPGSAAKDSKQS